MRFALVVMLLLTLGLAPCRAQDIPAGTVTSASSALEGTYNVSFPTVAGIQIRDVFNVIRAGKPVGQAMALSIDPATNTVSLSGLASFQGTMKPGDSVVFVRHDAVPVTQPPPQLPPSGVVGDIPPPQTPLRDDLSFDSDDVSAPYAYYYPWYHDGPWGPAPGYGPYYPHDNFHNVRVMGAPGAATAVSGGIRR